MVYPLLRTQVSVKIHARTMLKSFMRRGISTESDVLTSLLLAAVKTLSTFSATLCKYAFPYVQVIAITSNPLNSDLRVRSIATASSDPASVSIITFCAA